MTNDGTWILIDDAKTEAQAFADSLSASGRLKVEVISPNEARLALLSEGRQPAGALIDVDLSSIEGETGTGPGIAQDIRVKQRARAVPEYPLVRFAALAPVQKNVRGDPTSDDLFDLKIQKEAVSRDINTVISQLMGLRELYNALTDVSKIDNDVLVQLLGVGPDDLAILSHEAFGDRLLSSLQTAVHVAAGAFTRSFLFPPGLLLGEDLLAVRMGIDAQASGEAWPKLSQNLPFQYRGVASAHIRRWWARGLEAWWFDAVSSSAALVSLTASERVNTLHAKLGIEGLVELKLPEGSPGLRPWRLCSLCLERDPPENFPIDATEAVRLMPRSDLPIWVDPSYASLKYALQEREDLRLSRTDIARLSKKYANK